MAEGRNTVAEDWSRHSLHGSPPVPPLISLVEIAECGQRRTRARMNTKRWLGEAAVGRTSIALRLAILPITVLGLLIRLAAAHSLPVHFDEGSTLLGVHAVAERGWPLLPSGVLYLHGTTLSYLVAPLVWLGWGGLDDLFILRSVNAILGAITVYLTYRLARAVVQTTAPALLAATFVALDPLSVVWGGWLRMYALEQTLAVAIAWLFVRQVVLEARTVRPVRQWRELAGVVVAFWLAVFTHLSAALLWPGMAAAAALLHGRALLGSRRSLTVALGLCALAPVVFVATSTWGGAAGAATGRNEAGPLPAGYFLGDHLLNLGGVLHPQPGAWAALFGVGVLGGIMPWLVFLLSGLLALLVGRAFLAGRGENGKHDRWRAMAVLLLLYWLPVLAFVAVTATDRARYLLFLQPLGYVLVAAAVTLPWTSAIRPVATSRQTRLLGATVVGLVLLLAIHLGGGLARLSDLALNEGAVANRVEALGYVATHGAPGDPIFVSWPPDAYLVLGNRPEIRALGPLPMGRTAQGESIDFWVGWPVTNPEMTIENPCALLGDHRGAWFVLEPYLGSSQALIDLAQGTAAAVFPPSVDDNGNSTLVLYSPQDRSLNRKAVRACQSRLRAANGR
jgi:hypothetical protein